MTLLDPFHYTAEEIAEDDVDSEYTGPTMPWDHFMAIAFPGGKLEEHYGPGPHKSGSSQASHRKGGAGRAAKRAISDIEQHGGTSVRTSGMVPSTGIMVSYPASAGHNTVINVAGKSRDQVHARVTEFVERERQFVTSHADRYLGGWREGDNLHLDVSRNFPPERRDAAIAAGRAANQMAVFDLDTFTDIPTGGSGT